MIGRLFGLFLVNEDAIRSLLLTMTRPRVGHLCGEMTNPPGRSAPRSDRSQIRPDLVVSAFNVKPWKRERLSFPPIRAHCNLSGSLRLGVVRGVVSVCVFVVRMWRLRDGEPNAAHRPVDAVFIAVVTPVCSTPHISLYREQQAVNKVGFKMQYFLLVSLLRSLTPSFCWSDLFWTYNPDVEISNMGGSFMDPFVSRLLCFFRLPSHLLLRIRAKWES